MGHEESVVSIRAFLQQLDIPEGKYSSVGKGWNDPRNAYSAIVRYLKQGNTSMKNIKSNFEFEKITIYNGKKYPQSLSSILLRRVDKKHVQKLQNMLYNSMVKGGAKEFLGKINNYLVLFVDRFENSIQPQRFKIQLHQEMDVSVPCQDKKQKNKKLKLQLRALVCQDQIHSTSYVKNSNKWYHCDDSYIQLMSAYFTSQLTSYSQNASVLIFKNI